MTGVLTLEENDSGADYVLDESATSCWITVDNISVYIVRTDEGVSVDLYAKGRESDESLAGTWALNQEAATEEELAMGMSVPHTDPSGLPIVYRNFYECSGCGFKWEDCWSCMCDDRCFKCNTPTSPYKSEDI